jgi:2-methylisocitrate lyase-like PEP mutase family enzyme
MSDPTHVARLRALLAAGADGRRRLASVPGCWDGLTGLLIEQAGFEAAFLTGGGFTMTRLGRPDLALTTSVEVAGAIAVIRDRVAIPLLVDADTGFGNALNVQRTVRQFERAGASAIQLEDQTFPKRCGHMAGKGVIPKGEAVGKLKAALDARDRALIVARTDAVSVEGFDSAMERAEAFIEAGADLVFVEGPRTLEETQEVGRRLGPRIPLVHNLLEGGVTATKRGSDLEAMGYAVALHPLMLLHGFAKAAPAWLARLKADRSTEAFEDQLLTLKDINGITGAAEMIAAGDSYGSADDGR